MRDKETMGSQRGYHVATKSANRFVEEVKDGGKIFQSLETADARPFNLFTGLQRSEV